MSLGTILLSLVGVGAPEELAWGSWALLATGAHLGTQSERVRAFRTLLSEVWRQT